MKATAYTPPTPDDIRALMKAQGLTGSDAARITGVNSRTVRRWTGGDVPMPYAAWSLLTGAQKPLPENGVVVYQKGPKDAIVAHVRTWYDVRGREMRHVGHDRMHKYGDYWFRYNPRTSEWSQLFGFYGGRGDAMMEARLPGHHVSSEDDLPEEVSAYEEIDD